MTVDAYLDRLDQSGSTSAPTFPVLKRLQRAHVTTIPFENVSIVGTPYSPPSGPGVDLSIEAVYQKVVDRRRGGYCFELNGLFHWMLGELGYTVDRLAARVVSGQALHTPANHQVLLVRLDEPYVVDVGTGPPMLREPLPLDGMPRTDDAGVTWRIRESTRPDADYRAEVRPAGRSEWAVRYVFTTTPRPPSYFAAANDYLQSAPESPFTGSVLVARSTPRGYNKLSGHTLTTVRNGTTHERTVADTDGLDVLRDTFDLSV